MIVDTTMIQNERAEGEQTPIVGPDMTLVVRV